MQAILRITRKAHRVVAQVHVSALRAACTVADRKAKAMFVEADIAASAAEFARKQAVQAHVQAGIAAQAACDIRSAATHEAALVGIKL